ncbi:HDOD domain-containing protein [Hydrogenimonas sp. SS33]|uniref:HDOD domain-containing protein n=1 Tax=Hydrogenimonas leucolamina TaxID=2954236 RepID=UPI00336C26D3
MTNSHLVQRISSLPPLPQTVTQIEAAYADPNVDAKKVAEIVEKDPMVVADLLKLLNSAFYGLRKEITSVEQAVALLGMKSVKDLVINLSVRNILRTNLSPYGINSEEFAKVSQFQSMLAQRWMKAVNPAKTEKIRLLALLQEIGKIVISDELLREGEDATFRAELDAGWDIRETERNYIDATTAEVSAAMLEHWEFEKSMCDTIRWADMPNQADGDMKEEAWVLRVSSEAVSVRQPLSEKNRKRALNLAIKAGLPEAELQEAMEELAERWNG